VKREEIPAEILRRIGKPMLLRELVEKCTEMSGSKDKKIAEWFDWFMRKKCPGMMLAAYPESEQIWVYMKDWAMEPGGLPTGGATGGGADVMKGVGVTAEIGPKSRESIEKMLKAITRDPDKLHEQNKPWVPQGIPEFVPRQLDDLSVTDLEMLLHAIVTNRPVLLKGPPGCGKTHSVEWAAAKTNNAVRTFVFTDHTEPHELIGHWLLKDGSMEWVDGDLTQAMTYGQWFNADELNMARGETLSVLNEVTDHRRQLTLKELGGKVVKAHPDFRFIGCINPTEEGIYAGTKQLNEALVDRFKTSVVYDYLPFDVEVALIVRVTGSTVPIAQKIVRVANRIRDASTKGEGELVTTCSTRKCIDWAELAAIFGFKAAAECTLLAKADKDEREQLRSFVEAVA